MENFHQKRRVKLWASNLRWPPGRSCLVHDLTTPLWGGSPQQSSVSPRQPSLLCVVTGKHGSSVPGRFCSPGIQPCKGVPPKYPWKARHGWDGGLFDKLPTPQLLAQSQRKKSRGHHKFGTFIYATDFLQRKESQKEEE